MKQLALWAVAAVVVVWLVQYPQSAAHIISALATALNHALAGLVRFAGRL